MSGHSKWSKVKHQKAVSDVAKGKAFTKASQVIAVAIRESGGITDPNSNFKLRLAIEKARAVNMPKDTIERAIERAKGQNAQAIEQVLYEAFGPNGAAILIEVATDNRQRTVAAVKNVLERSGGTLAGPGAVSFQFVRSGVITVGKKDMTYDELFTKALEAGADDIVEKDDVYELYTKDINLIKVRDALVKEGINIDNAELIMKPTLHVDLPPEKRAILEKLVSDLEDLDDTQRVYTNTL